uniref:Uncharacterized protein n=1 Tax=Arundo donax TaxID=35708 RepID=A0A0A8ZTX0_ARUDO
MPYSTTSNLLWWKCGGEFVFIVVLFIGIFLMLAFIKLNFVLVFRIISTSIFAWQFYFVVYRVFVYYYHP